MERSLKMLEIYGICISFASRQIVNLLGANGVHIMPGTSSSEKSFDQKWPELLSFIGFQYINYLANPLKNRAV